MQSFVEWSIRREMFQKSGLKGEKISAKAVERKGPTRVELTAGGVARQCDHLWAAMSLAPGLTMQAF
jgi:hypothetical protein